MKKRKNTAWICSTQDTKNVFGQDSMKISRVFFVLTFSPAAFLDLAQTRKIQCVKLNTENNILTHRH